MNKPTSIIIIFFIVYLLSHEIHAKDDLIISEKKMRKLDRKGRVYPVRILNSGWMVAVSEREHDTCRILLVSPHGRTRRWIKTPLEKIDYITCNDNGDKAIIYTQDNLEFVFVDLKRRKFKSIFSLEKGKTGFALYGEKKSWLSFNGDEIFARGYYYNSEELFVSDNIVKIIPDNVGIKVFEPVVEINQLTEGAKQFYPSATNITNLNTSGKYIFFTAGDKSGGVLLALDLKAFLIHRIGDFRSFYGNSYHPGKNLLAYTAKRTSDPMETGELVLYDMNTRKMLKTWKGRYYHPVFDNDGERIAVGLTVPIIEGKSITQIPVFSVSPQTEFRKEDELLPRYNPIDWIFVDKGRYLYLFTGEEVYRHKFK